MLIPAKYLDGQPDPWELQPVAADKRLHVGTALAFSGGTLNIASGATMPEFICMQEVEASAAGQMVPVIRVSADTLYETELAEAVWFPREQVPEQKSLQSLTSTMVEAFRQNRYPR